MVGAGARHQNPAWRQQPQGAQVDLFISGDGGVHMPAALGEGRRVEDDQLVGTAGRGEELEHVGFAEGDVPDPVGGGVGPGRIQRGGR